MPECTKLTTKTIIIYLADNLEVAVKALLLLIIKDKIILNVKLEELFTIFKQLHQEIELAQTA